MEEDSLFQRMRRVFQVEEEMDEGTQKEAASLIQNIFRYLDKNARDIMTHRKNIVAIDGEDTLEEAFQFMLGESFSRFPFSMRISMRSLASFISGRRLSAI